MVQRPNIRKFGDVVECEDDVKDQQSDMRESDPRCPRSVNEKRQVMLRQNGGSVGYTPYVYG